jgi:phospholipid/cholesterol/gamma-HCH transport system permease protein
MELISPADYAKQTVQTIQDYSLLAWQSITNVFSHPRYVTDTLQQADSVGVGSIPVVVLTGFFTGAVLALQSANSLARFGALSLTGQLVSLSMVRELGPVLTGLMVAGRNASGMASELGSMKVTEQIDAMRALGTDPSKKLVTPRVVATTTMLFFLTIISDLLGLTGGYMVAYFILGLDTYQYWNTAYQSLVFADVFMGLTKPILYGFIIATVASYLGVHTTRGTEGVGQASTRSVVYASMLLIVANVLLVRLIFFFYPS